jgi:hypothetical protein
MSSTLLSSYITDVEQRLKRSLKVGDKIQHSRLGHVVFDEHCAEMEKRDGQPTSLYVYHDGDIKEVTLTLIERITNDGRFLRMEVLSDKLAEDLVKVNTAIDELIEMEILLARQTSACANACINEINKQLVRPHRFP